MDEEENLFSKGMTIKVKAEKKVEDKKLCLTFEYTFGMDEGLMDGIIEYLDSDRSVDMHFDHLASFIHFALITNHPKSKTGHKEMI